MERLSITSVISDSIQSFRQNILLILAACVILLIIPSKLFQYFLMIPFITSGNAIAHPWLIVVLGQLSILLQLLLMSAIAYCVIQNEDGQKASFGTMVSAGFSSLLVLAVIYVFFILVAGLSVFLLFIPIIIISCMWWVVVPVAVAEKLSIMGCIRRSNQLTKGSRWIIFSLMLLYILLIMAVSIINLYLLYGTVGLDWRNMINGNKAMLKAMRNPSGNFLILQFVSQVIGTILVGFISVVVAVCYVQLRRLKDGVTVNQVSSVFA
jgi:hypothetical protein